MQHDTERLGTDPLDDTLDDALQLTCPICEAVLPEDDTFQTDRVCGDCGRHFSLSARHRAHLHVDPGSFQELSAPMPFEGDPDNDLVSSFDRIAELHERPILDEAIVVGTGTFSGIESVVIAMDDQLLGAQFGALGAEKIILALEHALTRRLPVVAFCAGGPSRTQPGALAMAQGSRLAAVATQLQVASLPMIAVLAHPTPAEIFSSFASQCDVIVTEPGTQLGVAWAAAQSLDAVGQALTDEQLLLHGWIDGIVPRQMLGVYLGTLLGLLANRNTGDSPVPPFVPAELAEDAASRRPRGVDYLPRLVTSFIEICGDRVEADDRQVVCGLGRLGDTAVAVVAQDSAAAEPVSSTAVTRKVQRLARLAGRFELPLVMLVDAPRQSAAHVIHPDESLAIAKLGSMLAMLPVPVISIAVGMVRGVFGNVMMTGDHRLMQEHATWHLPGSFGVRGGRIPTPPAGVESGHAWPARECERLGLVDRVISEPAGGAEADPGLAAARLKDAVKESLASLSASGPRRLIEMRRRRHRSLGQETEEGLAAIRGELREWQEVQQSVAKSIDDWRERLEQQPVAKSIEEWREKLEHRMAQQPRLTFQRPDLGELAARFRERREELRQELLERTSRNDR